jgi:hypothetical protein
MRHSSRPAAAQVGREAFDRLVEIHVRVVPPERFPDDA